MNAKELFRKYGVWVIGGVVLVYLVLKNASGGRSGAIAGANQNALELAKLQSQERLASGRLGLESAEIAAKLEAERIRAASYADAAKRAADLRNRELGILSAQGAGSRLNSILNAIASAARRITGGGGSGSSGGGFPGTPKTFPGNPRLPQPVEPNLGPGIYNPPFEPAYPEPDLPGFELPGLTFDSGPTFSDQYSDFGFDWDYSVGFGGGGEAGAKESHDIYSDFPEFVSPTEKYYGGEDIYLTEPDYGYGDYGGGVDSGEAA